MTKAERINSAGVMAPAMTVRQVALEYGVRPDTVYGWIKLGLLRPIRLPGGDYRIRREHLAEFDEACRVQNAPPSDTTSASGPTAASGRSAGMRAGSDPFLRARETATQPSN